MVASESQSSFRDPSGTVFLLPDRVFRKISAQASGEAIEFLESDLAVSLSRDGRLVSSSQIPDEEIRSKLNRRDLGRLDSYGPGGTILEHQRIWFPSYAYEWPGEMLHSAATLTLDLAEEALTYDYGLKDATPYNVLFRGPRPVFVDILSFEKREPGNYMWLPYGQFVRMFLLPLLTQKHLGVGLDQIFGARAHGLEPEEAYAQYSWIQRFKYPLLTEVSVPTWLKKQHRPLKKGLYRERATSNPEKASFILRSQFRRLRRAINRAAPAADRHSQWAEYMKNLSYSEEEFQSKHNFVSEALAVIRPSAVLDVGCNTGHFSVLAARAGARVVAIDIDPVVVGNTWHVASEERLDILPLVVNLARPTPATGWRNAEYSSFISRATGSFDLVFMLATLHHLLVTERIPLEEIIQLAAELTTGHAVIEYVAREDPMFQEIARGRDNLHQTFTRELFETVCLRHFSIVRSEPVKQGLRWLYLLKKHAL